MAADRKGYLAVIIHVKMNEARMYTKCRVGVNNVAAAACATLYVGDGIGR